MATHTHRTVQSEHPLPITGRRSGADSELIETVKAILFQQRLVDFALQLEGDEREVFERRMLASRPASIASIADSLGISRNRVSRMVGDLQRRLRSALAAQELV